MLSFGTGVVRIDEVSLTWREPERNVTWAYQQSMVFDQMTCMSLQQVAELHQRLRHKLACIRHRETHPMNSYCIKCT